MKVAWFGAEVAPPTEGLWIDPILYSGAEVFAIVNWGEGLLIGLPLKRARLFRKYAEAQGWRLIEVVEPPSVPPCEPFPLPKFPVRISLGPRGGVLARRVPAGKWLVRYEKNHTAFIGGRPVRVRDSEDAEKARDSAYNYGCIFKAIAFTFADERSAGKGERKLAERVERLKAPRFLARELTPLELAKLTAELTAEAYGAQSPRDPKLQRLAEKMGFRFKLPLADGYLTHVAPGRDNSLFLCGAPESGKSLALDYYLSQMPENWNTIVIDPTGEHGVLAKWGFAVLRAGVDVKVNPLALGERAFDVLEGVLESLWKRGEERELTAAKLEVLRDAVSNARSLWDVYRNVASALESASREDVRNAAFGLKRRLEPMLRCPALYGGERAELPKGRTVVVTQLGREEAELAFIYTVLHTIYNAAKTGGWQGIVVIDEVDQLGDAEIVNRICDELRKYGVSVWAAGHSVARVPSKLADAKYQLYFQTTDPATLKHIDPDGEILPKLKRGQALARVRGWGLRVAPVTVPGELIEAKRNFRPPPEVPVSTVASRFGVDPYRLAAAFSRATCEALYRFVQGAATEEDLRLLRELGLRGTRLGELTKHGEACLELCREAGV
jgi:AraC-like DNA-binding protein